MGSELYQQFRSQNNLTSLVDLRKVYSKAGVTWPWRYTAVNMGSSQSNRGPNTFRRAISVQDYLSKNQSVFDFDMLPEHIDRTNSSNSNTMENSDFWSQYTPWVNGYHHFKEDVSSKCSRFVNTYLYGTPPRNNNHHLCKSNNIIEYGLY